MPEVKAQKIPQNNKKLKALDLIATFCYYFPQYTFSQARKMPYSRIIHMLSIVRKEQARHYSYLTRIVASPYTKKGIGVKNLLAEFADIMKK